MRWRQGASFKSQQQLNSGLKDEERKKTAYLSSFFATLSTYQKNNYSKQEIYLVNFE